LPGKQSLHRKFRWMGRDQETTRSSSSWLLAGHRSTRDSRSDRSTR